jgi:hypothetical protein
MRNFFYPLLLFAALFSSCRQEEVIHGSSSSNVGKPVYSEIEGFYLLNEGNMGLNKSSLDYYDATTATYHRNIYAERNPNVVKELGDVGNDLQIYGSKLYAVINCSHKMEVMNADDATRVAKIDIPNCRYVVGHKGYVYVSSYVGPVQIDPTAPKGAVFKVDTLTMNVVGNVEVGYQPEEMSVIGNKLYVANSGGYRIGNYENTVSVIDLDKFEVCDVLELEGVQNLHRMDVDSKGRLWVSSRGDYYGSVSTLVVVDPQSGKTLKNMNIPVSNMWVDDDVAYIISSEYSKVTETEEITYAKVDMLNMEILSRQLITDGTDKKIKIPYGIAVNPVTKDIYITDAKSYVVSGTLYCFDKNGVKLWQQTAGQIPNSFTFKGK